MNASSSGTGAVMVATDRSESADRAVEWAVSLARSSGSELLVLQVIAPGTGDPGVASLRHAEAEAALDAYAKGLVGEQGRGLVVADEDAARGILETAERERVDTLVVGNSGMGGRKEFLLGNVPNRVSHSARCNVVIVNTTLPGSGPIPTTPAVARGEQAPGREPEPHILGRAGQIARVLAKHGLRELFERGDPGDDHRQARRLRAALEELGPTFCKLGQILSTRPDLLPAPFIDELAALQDDVPPLSEEEVVSAMEAELGVPWEDVFETIEPTPMAAGTIAQVHRATLTGGKRVVVKVQRPTAGEEITQDLALLELFAEKTHRRPALRKVIDLPAVFEHLSTSLKRELDFRREAENIERMRDVLAAYPRLGVPEVQGAYTTPRLLVMQEIQGIPIREAPIGKARKDAARQLVESYYRQVLVEGFFHADPHPGNLMWWDDTLYFLDFGMVGEVGPQMREQLMLLLMAFWQEDAAFLTDVTLMMSGASDEGIDVERFRAELGELLSKNRDLPLKEIELGPILQEMTQISMRHDVPLPASLTLTAKALAQMQLAAAELDPELDPFDVAGKFLVRSVTGNMAEKADPKKLFYESQKLRVRAARILEAVERLTGARPGPPPKVDFRAVGLEQVIRRAGRRLSLGMTAGAALLGGALTAGAGVAVWVPVAFGALGAALVVGLLLEMIRSKD